MSPQVVGDKTDPVIATSTVIVKDPTTGTFRQIHAGKRVPGELVDAYEAGDDYTGDEDAVVGGVDPNAEDAGSGDGQVSERMTRAELDKIAEDEGLDPGDYASKADVVDAIKVARGE